VTPRAAVAACAAEVDSLLDQALPGLPARVRAQLRDVTLRASAWKESLSGMQTGLECPTSSRQLRRNVRRLVVEPVEAAINDALWRQARRLRRRCFVAVDTHFIPYHGEADRDEDELRRSKAKDGTTWFHCYATLCITMHGKRYTLAVTFVRKGQSMANVLNRLLENVLARGLRIACLTADKGFCNRASIEALQRHRVAFVIPLALRGRAARALQRGRRSYTTTHTMAGITLPCAVVVKRNGKKYHGRKPGNQYFPYLYHGLDAPPKIIGKLYAKRGGIETTYRLANQCRARTTSRNPAARLFLFGVALLLQNAWINTTWQVSQATRGRQGRKRPAGFFTLTTFLQLICAHIERVRHRVLEITQISGEK
jgi:hypothetical protein